MAQAPPPVSSLLMVVAAQPKAAVPHDHGMVHVSCNRSRILAAIAIALNIIFLKWKKFFYVEHWTTNW